MSRGPDAATLLARALDASAVEAACPIAIAEQDWTRWASATFTGARHVIKLTAPWSERLRAWIAALPDAEFKLRGHLVADLVVERVRQADGVAHIGLEILTIEER